MTTFSESTITLLLLEKNSLNFVLRRRIDGKVGRGSCCGTQVLSCGGKRNTGWLGCEVHGGKGGDRASLIADFVVYDWKSDNSS